MTDQKDKGNGTILTVDVPKGDRVTQMQMKAGQVLASCPYCGAKQRAEDEMGVIKTSYAVVVGPKEVIPSLPKTACLKCGGEYFGRMELEQLRAKAKASQSRIIVPKGPIVPAP